MTPAESNRDKAIEHFARTRLNGSKLLQKVGKLEDKCERSTEKHLPHMGKRAPQCYEYLGQVLA